MRDRRLANRPQRHDVDGDALMLRTNAYGRATRLARAGATPGPRRSTYVHRAAESVPLAEPMPETVDDSPTILERVATTITIVALAWVIVGVAAIFLSGRFPA